MNLGLAREKRLLKARQFQEVFGSPDGKLSSRQLLLLTRENGLSFPRLGLVIGKKNVKLAVQRNRLKRVIRDSFRRYQQQLPNLDIMVVARRGLGDLPNPELHQLLEKQWRRLSRDQISAIHREPEKAMLSHA